MSEYVITEQDWIVTPRTGLTDEEVLSDWVSET